MNKTKILIAAALAVLSINAQATDIHMIDVTANVEGACVFSNPNQLNQVNFFLSQNDMKQNPLGEQSETLNFKYQCTKGTVSVFSSQDDGSYFFNVDGGAPIKIYNTKLSGEGLVGLGFGGIESDLEYTHKVSIKNGDFAKLPAGAYSGSYYITVSQ